MESRPTASVRELLGPLTLMTFNGANQMGSGVLWGIQCTCFLIRMQKQVGRVGWVIQSPPWLLPGTQTPGGRPKMALRRWGVCTWLSEAG